MPWALGLASMCYDMANGILLRLPEPERGPMGQNEVFMYLMQIARRIWYIEDFKLAHRMPVTDDDREFMRSVLGITRDGR